MYISAHPLDEFRFEFDSLCNVTCGELKSNIEKYIDKDVTFAGMVVAAKIDNTKNGKPYGRITIEDYSDSYDIMLFGKDFENYRKFCYVGYYLLVRGTIQPKRYKNDELELHINAINMLYDVKEKMIKSLTLNFPINEINDFLIDELLKYVKRDKAKIALKLKVYDPEDLISVEMFSRIYRVELTNEFVDFLYDNEVKFNVAIE